MWVQGEKEHVLSPFAIHVDIPDALDFSPVA